MLEAVKKACRVTAAAYDDELIGLIAAAKADLALAGVKKEKAENDTDPLIKRAVITCCKLNFGAPENYDTLKASYDEQKAQLQGAATYAEWGTDDGES